MREIEYSLGRHCGITFAGIKPASLFCLEKTKLEGLDYYAHRFLKKGIFFIRLRECEERGLIYVYHREKLEEILMDKAVRIFLTKSGYHYRTVEEAVFILRQRINSGDDFPHEIGIFLGYPLEDVEGFIHSPHEGVQLCGYWKVYSNPDEKAKIFHRYKRCTESICQKIRGGELLTQIFKVS